MGCPSDEDLACHAAGHEAPEVAAHLAGCAACADVVAALRVPVEAPSSGPVTITAAPVVGAGAGDAAGPTPGSLIDRYVVLRPLGRGGMGVVVLAYDPILDRTVAVKLVRADRSSPLLAARLEREARSLARIAHPNVVRVFDAGTWAGRVFLAMEHVEGEPASAWLRAAPRRTAEILTVFAAAGRGLVATHDAGFVHRDVKPGNILVGADGVARLADFGLVGADPAPDVPGAAPTETDARAPAAPREATPLTRPTAAMGTPGYMAPEQRGGGVVGAAADQYAFCASLWEALAGARPGEPAAPAATAPGVPAWLREVLERGLQADPAARWPSMRALLDALARDPAATRRRRLVAAGGGAALLGLGVALALAVARPAAAPDRRCRDLDAELVGVWAPAHAARLDRALAATGRPHAAATARRVAAALDDYAGRWVAARIEACEATHVRGVQSAAALDLRMACLESRLRDVGALVDVLTDDASADALELAAPAVLRLPALDACRDVAGLQAVRPPPAAPELRAELDAARAELAAGRANEATGRYAPGLALARAAVERARRAGHAPTEAEALHLRASLEERGGDPRAAEATLREALIAAGVAHDDRRAAAIWADLIYVVGGPLARPDDALALRAGAEAAVARAEGDAHAEPRLLLALAMCHHARGDLDAARAAQQGAIARLEQTRGHDHADLAPALGALGNTLHAQGAYAEALAAHDRALTIAEAALGPDHPTVAAAVTNLGIVLHAMGRLDEAGARHERAVSSFEAALGPDHPSVAASLTNLGLVRLDQGRLDEARAAHARALALRERALDDHHPDVAVSLDNLGGVAFAAGDLDEARALHARALAIRTRALGDDHVDVATSRYNLARALTSDGDPRAALALLDQAIATWRARLGPEHPHVALALVEQARARRALGERAAACADARRAAELLRAAAAAPRAEAEAERAAACDRAVRPQE